MFLPLKPAKLFRIAALGLAQLLLCFSFVSAAVALPVISPSLDSVSHSAQAVDEKPLDVDQASERADQATDKIFEGLDSTKRLIGKTEKRNQVIEEARGHASTKLKSLADKAREAPNPDESLDLSEKQVLRQLQE